jgi:hypothetical protein
MAKREPTEPTAPGPQPIRPSTMVGEMGGGLVFSPDDPQPIRPSTMVGELGGGLEFSPDDPQPLRPYPVVDPTAGRPWRRIALRVRRRRP